MNVQAVPITQTRRCLLPFCTVWPRDFATGILHLFLLPVDLPWPGDGLGWPRLCHRALLSLVSCRVSYPRWLHLEEQTASITCPNGRDQGAGVVEAAAWGQTAKAGGRGAFPKVPALLPPEPAHVPGPPSVLAQA